MPVTISTTLFMLPTYLYLSVFFLGIYHFVPELRLFCLDLVAQLFNTIWAWLGPADGLKPGHAQPYLKCLISSFDIDCNSSYVKWTERSNLWRESIQQFDNSIYIPQSYQNSPQLCGIVSESFSESIPLPFGHIRNEDLYVQPQTPRHPHGPPSIGENIHY